MASKSPSDPAARPPDNHEGAAKGTTRVASKAAQDDHLELRDMLATDAQRPAQEDVMQLARLGDLNGIRRLFQQGEFTATYQDGEGVTPLHWAAINNQYAVCEYLLEIGADVNAKGGSSVATPAMWAAQRCNYYVVNLLLRHGADPLLTDVQGYNLLHLATFDGSTFLIVLLLHQNVSVDVPDPQGHTPLMWAAFKGYPVCVDLFLRWGANVYAIDENGFTALHWALVKGVYGSIQKLIEYGSDRSAKTSEGKTPFVVAEEMRSQFVYLRALADCGFDDEGNSRHYFGESVLKAKGTITKLFFFWPFFMIWSVLMILSHMLVYAAVPLAAIMAYGLLWIAQGALVVAPPDMRQIHKTVSPPS
ncbi:MAG: palmitoyltransferase akr1 [Phylliscum demangeonii]|nr:MAG: palmitoyltransferase akr1 [Phylliscum demangeonii]